MKQKQRILLVTHYYPPECNAPARRMSELARCWQAAGREVQIVTGMPNHPHGNLLHEYRGRWYKREEHDGVTVHRGRIYPAANKGIWRRGLNYLSFCISAVITGAMRAGRTDCVVATSPQLLCALAGWLLAIIKHAPFVFEVRDLWPEEIVAVGAIRNRFVIRALSYLEMFLYRRADKIVAVADGTVELLSARGIPREKLIMIPNGVDIAAFTPGPRDYAVRQQNNLNGEFVVSYIGTVGMAHRLEVVLDAASLLADNPEIRFLIVGDGAERAHLERETQKRRLNNVIWAEPQPVNRVAAYYRMSDACLVHMRKADLFTRNIPSKMYEIMACGRPILLGTEGESRRLAEKAACAVPFAPESAHELAAAATALSRNTDLAERLGRTGRRFVVENCDRRILSQEYLEVIDSLSEPTADDGIPGTEPREWNLRNVAGTLHTY